VVLTLNQFFTAGQVVSQTDLLTVVPRHFVASTGIVSQLVVRALPLDLPIVHVELLWHQRHTLRAAHVWLRGVIVEAASAAFAQSPAASGVEPGR